MLAAGADVEEGTVSRFELDDVDRFYAKLSGFVAAALLTASVVGASFVSRAAPAAPRAISTVIVEDETGHGSGVHIGGGLILTAAHVVEDNSEMTIVDSLGHEQLAVVMRSDKATDVALLRIDQATMAATTLDCSVRPAVGDEITAVGNPLNLKFVTIWGHVAAGKAERHPWKESLIVEMVVVPGMSGGGVFDRSGRLIGLAVGVASLGKVLFGLGYVVPVQAACELMEQA
jgi:S1-C subfamily serine protease